jgi:hypothetical protein
MSIFLSYRRQDSASTAGRLADALAVRYGPETVLLDIANITPGVDFRSHIIRAIIESDAVLVIIGPKWLHATNSNGDRFLDRPEDFVRSELRAALAYHKLVVPVLVGGAQAPPTNLLPEDISALSQLQAFRLESESWAHDVSQLVKRLDSARRPASLVRPWWIRWFSWMK